MIPGKGHLRPNLAVFLPQIVMCYLDDSLKLWYVLPSWQMCVLLEHARFGVNVFQIV